MGTSRLNTSNTPDSTHHTLGCGFFPIYQSLLDNGSKKFAGRLGNQYLAPGPFSYSVHRALALTRAFAVASYALHSCRGLDPTMPKATVTAALSVFLGPSPPLAPYLKSQNSCLPAQLSEAPSPFCTLQRRQLAPPRPHASVWKRPGCPEDKHRAPGINLPPPATREK